MPLLRIYGVPDGSRPSLVLKAESQRTASATGSVFADEAWSNATNKEVL